MILEDGEEQWPDGERGECGHGSEAGQVDVEIAGEGVFLGRSTWGVHWWGGGHTPMVANMYAYTSSAFWWTPEGRTGLRHCERRRATVSLWGTTAMSAGWACKAYVEHVDT